MELHKLQMIQNSAARLVTGTHRRDHITPVLFKLHWLPVRYRIKFKLLVLVYQAVHHLGPAYLTSLVTPYAPTCSLRSAAHRYLTIPRYNLERYGRRAFSVAGPSLWNNLPVTIREAGTLTTFKYTLKTHIFQIACTVLRWTDIFLLWNWLLSVILMTSIIIQLIVLYSLYIYIYF